MSSAISIKNSAYSQVSLVFETSSSITEFAIRHLLLLPTCQVATQDTATYRFCKPKDATPTWDKSKILQTSLYHWQRDRLEVLAFANPLLKKHDRGTVLETAMLTANASDLNPLDYNDPNFFDLGSFEIQNTSANDSNGSNATSSRRLASPDSDLEEMGRTEDMRSLTSQCYRKGSAAELAGRISLKDEARPEVVSAEMRDGLGELRLHFSEWVSKARAKMLVAGLEILRPSRRLQEEGFYSVQHYEVNLTKPGTMFMEAGGKSAVLQIHQQLLAAGCGEIESKCQAVLEMPEGAFLDRNRNPSKSHSLLLDDISPLVASAASRRLRAQRNRQAEG